MGSFTEATVVHTEYNDANNTRSWTLPGHTEAKPQVVIQKRRDIGVGDERKLESEYKTVFGTVDANGDPLDTKIQITTVARYPAKGAIADLQAAVDEHQLLTASSLLDGVIEKRTYFG